MRTGVIALVSVSLPCACCATASKDILATDLRFERTPKHFDDAKYRRDLASLLRAELKGRSI